MDTFFRRVKWFGCLVLLLIAARANATCQEFDTAMAQCQASIPHDLEEGTGVATSTCGTRAHVGGDGLQEIEIYKTLVFKPEFGGGTREERIGFFVCDRPQPPDPTACDGQGDMNGAFAGNLSAGASLCSRQADGTTGCAMSFTPDSPPFLNRAGTQWGTHGTYKKTGGACTPAGDNAPPPPVPAKSCGGQSCYDSAGDKYCSTNAAGVQNCVTGKDARKPGGACATSGDNTICAGTPQAPKPPPPPQSPISDPPTETKGSDAFTQGQNGAGGTSAGGGNQTTTTTNYGAGGAPSQSGQAPGDDGPAHSSSSGSGSGGDGDGDGKEGDGTGASGGGDCSNPPAVSGSPALAMVARQAWETRCATNKVHEDLAGDGKTSPGDITTPSGATVWVDTPVSGDAVADAANKGTYDVSGMGFSTTCPLHDLVVPLWAGKTFSIEFSKGCPVGLWIKAVVIGFALLSAASITVGRS